MKEIIENHARFEARKALYVKYGFDPERERDSIIEKASPISGDILEAGTGKGYFTLALAQRGFHFTAFDLSPAELKCAQPNLMYYGREEQVRFEVADAESLPYGDGRFDFIFSVNMIHHLSTLEKVVSELIRVLAPAGKLVISDLNAQGLLMMDKIHSLNGRGHESGPCTVPDVAKSLDERGFEVNLYHGANHDTLVGSRRISS